MARDYTKFANKDQVQTFKPLTAANSSAANIDGSSKTFSAIDPRHSAPPNKNINDSPLWDKLLSAAFHVEMQDPDSELPLSWALYELRFRGAILRYTRFADNSEGYKLFPVVGGAGEMPDGTPWSNWRSQVEYAAEAKRLLAPHGELLRIALQKLKDEEPPDL